MAGHFREACPTKPTTALATTGRSDSPDAHAMIGHHDRMSGWNTSWNSSHSTAGCSLAAFNDTGGAGRFYCFATD